MWGLEKLEGNEAAQLGLLSAGAAMLDPRGTRGEIGASINKSVQAGLGTYIPMMQWNQNKKDRKEDRDWNKNQDVIRNTLAERQFKLRKATAEAELDNRTQSMDLQRARFGMAQKQFQQSQDMYNMRKEYYGEMMNPEPAAQFQQPGASAAARAQMRKPGEMSAPSNKDQLSALKGYTDNKFGQPAGPKGMSAYDTIGLGQFMGDPGMEQRGKDMASVQVHLEKALVDQGIKMSEVGVRGDPLGVGYIIYSKKTGLPIGSVGMDMEFQPAEGVKVTK